MLSPGWLFIVALAVYILLEYRLKWPLPATLIIVAVLASLLGGFGVPFRHLVEGGFGYYYLVLVLFTGAFFGHIMRESDAVDAVAAGVERAFRARPWIILTMAGALVFSIGMFTGIAGVAVLAVGVFAVPMLRRIGLANHQVAAFIALQAVFGMVAPPVNLPAMIIADGVNMPYANFERSLLALSLPPAIFSLWYFAKLLPRQAPERPITSGTLNLKMLFQGLLPLVVVVGFWSLIRSFPEVIPDPSTPFVLLTGVIVALPALRRRQWGSHLYAMFSGPVLLLGAVLVTVGVLVQIMTLMGIRGWLVINAVSLPSFWKYAGIVTSVPLLGGVLTSIGTANVLGVPFAFGFIQQNMILNTSALSAVAALAEFFPPTAISAILAGYLVGDMRVGMILRVAAIPLLVLLAFAVGMLILGQQLTRFLV